MSEDTCLGCRVGFHQECNDPQPHTTNICGPLAEFDEWFYTCCCWGSDGSTELISTAMPEKAEILGGYKENAAIIDKISTGRKRAAALYPITDGMACEWAGLKFAGGGSKPLIGCAGNLIYAAKGKGHLHHGPDKSTLNNTPGNIHRICPSCHNRWHALNDPTYGERPIDGSAFIPLSGEVLKHDGQSLATALERFTAEVYWNTKIIDRKGWVNV